MADDDNQAPQEKHDRTSGEPTHRQRLLVEGIITGKTQAQAAIDAGYSPKTAYSLANEALSNPKVQKYYQKRVDAALTDTNEIAAVLTTQMRGDFADFDGCILDNGDLDWPELRARGVSRLIRKLKITRRFVEGAPQVTTEIEIYSAQEAAKIHAQIHGMVKKAAANPDDIAWAKAELQRLIDAGYEREDAKKLLIQAEPKALDWLVG